MHGAVAAKRRLSPLRLCPGRKRPRAGSDAPLAFASCEAHRISSASGLAYKLSVSQPLSYSLAASRGEAAGPFPVLYVLDAEPYLFPLLATAARTNHFFTRTQWHPDFIVVGIVADLEDRFTEEPGRGRAPGLDVRRLWDALRPTRARDYLPTAAESPWGAPGAEPLIGVSGHATAFVRFLCSEVVPFIDRWYPTARAQRALIGKSFGGSGVAHALLDPEASQLFSHFLLGSPSIAWDDRAFFRLEEASVGSRPPLRAAVYLCVGEKESDAQLACARDFKRVLESRGAPGWTVFLDVIQGENHGSVSFPFAGRSVAWLAAQLSEGGVGR